MKVEREIQYMSTYFKGRNFRVPKKREFFDKSIRVWQFLQQILWKDLSRIQNKVYFCVKKLPQTAKIQEKKLFIKSYLRYLPKLKKDIIYTSLG